MVRNHPRPSSTAPSALDPLLRVLLDETANCAPLVVELLGREAIEVDDEHSTLGPLASAQDLQQLQRWRALIVAGSLPPALVRYAPYWRIGDIR